MNYEFYQDTLVSGFIKRLLSETKLPLYDIIHEGDFIIKNCDYIFNSQIINCTETGIVRNNSKNFVYKKYYQLGEQLLNETYSFTSNISYYDSKTHKYLGEYLRDYRGITDINLMPFYNCFSNFQLEDLYIKDKKIQKVPFKGTSKVVYIVPIKYNKIYTIALNCFDTIEVCPILWDRLGQVIRRNESGELLPIDEKLVENFYSSFTNVSIRQPVTWGIDLSFEGLKTTQNNEKIYDDDLLKNFYDQEDNLYMMIQLPNSIDSSIIILEGDYTNNIKQSKEYITSCDSSVSTSLVDFLSPLSLLQLDTKKIVPFSSRLIEYLLENVIDSREDISQNISRVQEYTDTIHKLKLADGVWDNKLQSYLFRNYMNNKNDYYWDISGFVDKDIEKQITKGLSV